MSLSFNTSFSISFVLAVFVVLLHPAFCQNLREQPMPENEIKKELNYRSGASFNAENQKVNEVSRILLPSFDKLETDDQPLLQYGNNDAIPSLIAQATQNLRQKRGAFPKMKILPPNAKIPVAAFSEPTASQLQDLQRSFSHLNSIDFSAYSTHQIDTQQRLQAMNWLDMVDEDLYTVTDLAKQQHDYYENKYKIQSYSELPFCIVVPTYNNLPKDRYLRNIRSIIMQNYQNYHVVVIDDGSTDGTGDLISSFLSQQALIPPEKYQVIKNNQSMKAMFNLRRAATEFCKGEQIFLIVDGDDELLGRQVLKLFNSQFQQHKAWFVYTNFLMDRFGKQGYSRPFTEWAKEKNNYRSVPFVTSHLRAFYTQLFRNIKEEDLRDETGEYYKAANDVAICLPILEQSHRRVLYVPELTYYYNSNTGQNNHLIRSMEQRSNEKKIRRKVSYAPLEMVVIDSN